MGVACLSECPACSRHLRCGERVCPFCGAQVMSLMRVLEYRVKTPLNRARLASLGAALATAGFVVGCEVQSQPMYGAPCDSLCGIAGSSVSGMGGLAGTGGTTDAGGVAGVGGASTAGGAGTSGGGGMTGDAGHAGSGAVAPVGGAAGEGGAPVEGGSGDGGASAGGDGGDAP